MGYKTRDDSYTNRFKTREEYLAYLEKMKVRYATDEEFRQKQIDTAKHNYRVMMNNPVLHEAYKAKKREYMRIYNERKRAAAGVERSNQGRRDLPAKSKSEQALHYAATLEAKRELRILIE